MESKLDKYVYKITLYDTLHMHTDVFDLHGDHRVYQLTGVLCRKFRTVHILYPFQVEFQLCLIRNLAFRGFVNWDTCWRGDPVSGLAGLQELHIGLSVTLPVGLLVPLCSSPGICLWLLSLPHSALLGALLLLLPATKAILDPGPLEVWRARDFAKVLTVLLEAIANEKRHWEIRS